MSKIHYLIGDATEPIKKPAMIIHCCNDAGGWGRGFVIALRNKYPESENAYRHWFTTGSPKLGEVQFVQVTSDICIANMIAQHGTRWEGKIAPIRYNALDMCLKIIYEKVAEDNVIVCGPRFGCVLAGGEWKVISPIIEKYISVETFIYTLENQKDRWDDVYENEEK